MNMGKKPVLQSFSQDAFALEKHLQAFLHLEPEILAALLHRQTAQQTLAELGRSGFHWDAAAHFYRDIVGTAYLFELATWHLDNKNYIGDTLQLTADQSRGVVLDFGGGIGTHSLAAAHYPQVKKVIFWDLNPVHREFVQFRARQLGLSNKIEFPADLDPSKCTFDTILCFDVIEHLPNPSIELHKFREMLSSNGRLILNWHFFKGFAQEFPFHLEDPEEVELFFLTLQREFLEVFHPYLITARCYRPWPGSS
jgi:cyclopropane fatty-acyl-phospholipid synthase-like methyltransferase